MKYLPVLLILITLVLLIDALKLNALKNKTLVRVIIFIKVAGFLLVLGNVLNIKYGINVLDYLF